LKHPLKEIALFVAIVPAFSVWVPLVLLLIMGIAHAEFGLTILVDWFAPGYWLMRLFGFTKQDLISGSSFMSLPSDLAAKSVLIIYTLIGLLFWMFSLYIRSLLRGPLWPEERNE